MTNRIMGGAAIAIVAGLVASVGPAGVGAHGGGASFSSTIRITNYIADMGGSSFLGKIGSENRNCKPDRKGKIFAKGPGDDELIGKGISDNQGRFSVPFDPPFAGRFYAKVGKDQIPAGACKGDRSPIFELN